MKSSGPDGIEDFGGQWRLAAFIEAMRNNPESEEYAETREWASLDTAEDLKKYLDGESLGQKTKKLRRALSHVKPPVQDAAKQEKPMTEEEKANVLGMIFARLVNAQLWQILDKAMRNGGTCEFEDPNKDIGEFFLTMFEGLKVKDGRSSLFYTDPSRLTVLPEWVEMYKKHGKEWGQLHDQFDILESYASGPWWKEIDEETKIALMRTLDLQDYESAETLHFEGWPKEESSDNPESPIAAVACAHLGISPREIEDWDEEGRRKGVYYKMPSVAVTGFDPATRTITGRVVPAAGTRIVSEPFKRAFGFKQYVADEKGYLIEGNDWGPWINAGDQGFELDLSDYRAGGTFRITYPDDVPEDKYPNFFKILLHDNAEQNW